MVYTNLGQLFVDRARLLRHKTAIHHKEGQGSYQTINWEDFSSFVTEVGYGLATLGVKQQTAVAILAPTSYLWVAADLATIVNGAFSVPLYPNCCLDDVEHILNNSAVEVVLVSGAKLLKRLLEVKDKLTSLKKIVYMLPANCNKTFEHLKSEYNLSEGLFISLDELREKGKALANAEPSLLDERIQAIKSQDIATIIYTSGTTGVPKGVPLTHHNILSLLADLPPIFPISENDVYFSYLPLSHVFERVCGQFYWLHSGGACAFAESMETVNKNLSEVEPTMLLVVPRILDRIHSKVRSGIEGAGSRARKLIEWSVGVGVEVIRLKQDGKPIRPTLSLKLWLAEKLVFRKLRERIGRRLRFIISGGAPATPSVIEFFNAIGIPTFEGYGLTETTAPTNANRFERIKVGTVGPKLPSLEVKIAEDGEILVKGASVFNGYYKDEASTKEAIVDGWFRTGDIGVIDSDGYLKITDRKKDLIVNAAGKNIAPQRIECLLKTVPCVTQVIVFGDKKRYLVALLSLDEQATTELAREKGWAFENFEQLTQNSELHKFLRKEIDLRSGKLAEYEVIRKFAVLSQDLSVETGELTATLKVKRNTVACKYATILDALYQEGANREESNSTESNSAR
jgi:long-chain acyl-CoA synthetase